MNAVSAGDSPPLRPLTGVRVVVTRADHQAGPTVTAFEAAGARVERLPLLQVVPPADEEPLREALANLDRYDWIAFTSSNAVHAVLRRLEMNTLPTGLQVAAIGPATEAALRARSIEPRLVAATPRAEGLAKQLLPLVDRRDRILLPQAADARATLEDALRQAGLSVLRVSAYAKELPSDRFRRSAEIFGGGPLGWVTFTSPSTARHFSQLFDDQWPIRRATLLAASIGPVTSDELRRLGVAVAAEARSPSDKELVDAVSRALVSTS